ncbi:hypothetical protein [Nocardia sp. NPDC051570]|uniref:hypothetical protein n=1 Tax=Nocardia sp. NPDC051570 TaxID=3364324 RepID=UPI0037A567F1
MPLLTVQLPQGATMGDALRTLHLTESEVDTGYGLISVDPATGLFALRVSDSAATRVSMNGAGATVFADPRVEPVGRGMRGRNSPP